MAWHPEGNSIFSVYNADDGDSQISVLNLNRTKGVRALLEIDYWRLINNCHFILILVYMFQVYIYACTRAELGRFSLGQPLEKKKREKKKYFWMHVIYVQFDYIKIFKYLLKIQLRIIINFCTGAFRTILLFSNQKNEFCPTLLAELLEFIF